MTFEPDYISWLSHEAISPHEFACLCLGIEPTPLSVAAAAGGDGCPAMPTEVGDYLDQSDWEGAYRRVPSVLSRAMEEGVLQVSPGGRITTVAGVRYLAAVAQEWGWADQLSRSRFMKEAKAQMEKSGSEGGATLARISDLEEKLAKCEARNAYSTPMLDMVRVVIEKYYSTGGEFPQRKEVLGFLEDQKVLSNGEKLSDSKVKAIWAVASDPSQSKGGRPRVKRPRTS